MAVPDYNLQSFVNQAVAFRRDNPAESTDYIVNLVAGHRAGHLPRQRRAEIADAIRVKLDPGAHIRPDVPDAPLPPAPLAPFPAPPVPAETAPATDKPILEISRDGWRKALVLAGWETAWDDTLPGRVARRTGEAEWQPWDAVQATMREDVAESACIAPRFAGGQPPQYVIASRNRFDSISESVCRERTIRGDGNMVYRACSEYIERLHGRGAITTGDLLKDADSLDRYESPATARRWKHASAAAALTDAGWTYKRSVRLPGVATPRKRWVGPEGISGEPVCLVGIDGGRKGVAL